jgi:hypothetical protein
MSGLLWNGFEAVVLAQVWFAGKVCEWVGAEAPVESGKNDPAAATVDRSIEFPGLY